MITTIQSASVRQAVDQSILAPAKRGSRAHGAIVGAGVALGATILGVTIGHVWGMALGIPAAAITGWLLGPRVRTDRSRIGVILAMAALTTAIADAMVVFGLGMATVFAGSVPPDVGPLELIASAAAFAVVTWLLGMIVVGILSLLVTIPCAVVWERTVRKLARETPAA